MRPIAQLTRTCLSRGPPLSTWTRQNTQCLCTSRHLHASRFLDGSGVSMWNMLSSPKQKKQDASAVAVENSTEEQPNIQQSDPYQDAAGEVGLNKDHGLEDARNMVILGYRGLKREFFVQRRLLRRRSVKSPVKIYGTASPMDNEADIKALIRCAVIETYTKVLLKKPPQTLFDRPTKLGVRQPINYLTTKVKVIKNPKTKQTNFVFESNELAKSLFRLPAVREPEGMNMLKAAASDKNDHWIDLSLGDADMKFTIIKRVIQLTGIRIPDISINESKDVSTLISKVLARSPASAKYTERYPLIAKQLSDTQSKSGEILSTLPNVKILPKRINEIDKERAIGRMATIDILEYNRKELDSYGANLPRKVKKRRYLGQGTMGIVRKDTYDLQPRLYEYIRKIRIPKEVEEEQAAEPTEPLEPDAPNVRDGVAKT